ncbi:MAG: hypothetical protein JJU45_16940 [Acidimicrobiia bacterium]|nr:hypothetical protein [Acidimicrobiia bacterium]
MARAGADRATASSALTRRRLLVGGVAATTAAWMAPSITTVQAAAAATCDPTVPPTLTMGANTSFVVPAVGENTSNLGDSTPAGDIPPSIPQSLVWFEQGPVTIGSALEVDATGPGTFTIPTTTGTDVVPVGTTVFSYYVHARRRVTGSAYFVGSLTVPVGYRVVGMAFRAPVQPAGTPITLQTTGSLARPDMTYRYNLSNGEGYEDCNYFTACAGFPPPSYVPAGIDRDTVIIGTGGTVQWVAFTGGNFSDDFRLLVAATC